MPGKIVVLPEDLTRKIAAGEVVERPASIVKELLENALDAGATDITVELERGGCRSIRIIDNGEGMEPSDVPLAFERYATSKIYQFDDIYKVKSYGFRGEALPSIASIARVEMVTKKRSSVSGTKFIVEAGHVKSNSDVGCPNGTSILVSGIFDPVPVRKQFFKSEKTEQGYCMDAVTKTALAHPHVRFLVKSNGKDMLNIPATQKESERISLVLGMDFMNHMLPVNTTKGPVSIQGFVSRPDQIRSSAKHMYFYVNRRYVRDHLMNHAVMTAYRHLIEAKKYPSVVLFVEVSTDDVDVNVHPTKIEVRFRNPRDVYNVIVEALVTPLAGISTVTEHFMTSEGGESFDKRPTGYKTRIEEALKRYTLSSGHGKLFFDRGQVLAHGDLFEGDDLYSLNRSRANEHEMPGECVVFTELEYLGQIAATYLVFSSPAGLTMVDQHAAHERILFEKFRGRSRQENGKIAGQRLLMPEVLNLSREDFHFLMETLDILEETGIEVEPFGENAVVVKSVPAMLAHVHPREIITDLLDVFFKEDRHKKIGEREEAIFALLACKGAIKANHTLSASEVAMLCRELDSTPFSSTCPHGRPVCVSFGVNELEKMFKRR